MRKINKRTVKRKVAKVAPKKKSLMTDFIDKDIPMNFGLALMAAKAGKKIAREGWNGKGMWVIYVPGTKKAELREGTPYANALGKRKFIEILPHFDMFTINASGRKAMLPGWLASSSDLDASDWCVVK